MLTFAAFWVQWIVSLSEKFFQRSILEVLYIEFSYGFWLHLCLAAGSYPRPGSHSRSASAALLIPASVCVGDLPCLRLGPRITEDLTSCCIGWDQLLQKLCMQDCDNIWQMHHQCRQFQLHHQCITNGCNSHCIINASRMHASARHPECMQFSLHHQCITNAWMNITIPCGLTWLRSSRYWERLRIRIRIDLSGDWWWC